MICCIHCGVVNRDLLAFIAKFNRSHEIPGNFNHQIPVSQGCSPLKKGQTHLSSGFAPLTLMEPCPVVLSESVTIQPNLIFCCFLFQTDFIKAPERQTLQSAYNDCWRFRNFASLWVWFSKAKAASPAQSQYCSTFTPKPPVNLDLSSACLSALFSLFL